MVLLTITPGILRGLESASQLVPGSLSTLPRDHDGPPTLSHAKLGDPISHAQLIALSKLLRQHHIPYTSDASPDAQDALRPATLSALLLSTTLHVPPPPPKPEPTPEYKALMSRLRRDQEALSYTRMLNPPSTRETFPSRFPTNSAPLPYSLGATPNANPLSSADDDITYEEVHRQIILIINILISIVAVSVFLWVAARHWSVGKRLGLAMGGSLGIAVAEVAVYGGYVRKVHEAKRVEKSKKEVKEVVGSWKLGGAKVGEAESRGKHQDEGDGMRYRRGKHR
ncbi:hypothetical protein NX059_004812 [Plenodomus lindquistii]|nr:hypothetical protein NX059_004812 [Plenodomus lindquistii]